MLPGFTGEGYLPPADYALTLEELRSSVLVGGPAAGFPNWDRAWRARLVENLAILVDELWQVGIEDIFDRYGNELEFPSAFRISRRDGEPRGIIKIVRGGQP